MQLSKSAYYADFVIYAVMVGILAITAALSTGLAERLRWFGAFILAGSFWTLLEYLLHRFVLHRLSTFAVMHAVHHASPRAFVGTPTWLTLAVLWLVFFVPARLGFSFSVASGLI